MRGGDALLMVPVSPRCSRCRETALLFALIWKLRLCRRCWVEAGRPWPEASTMHDTHQAEVAARERMQARGGTDRHLVRAGLS